MKSSILSIFVACVTGVWLAGCGPRVDGGGSGLVPSGNPPMVIQGGSQIPQPQPQPTIEGTLNGALVVFPIRFIVNAQDQDNDIRQVLVVVTYTDCNGAEQTQELTYQLTASEIAEQAVNGGIDLDVETPDSVRVPQDCFAYQNQFSVRLRVVDGRGNISSSSFLDSLIVNANQGSSGGT